MYTHSRHFKIDRYDAACIVECEILGDLTKEEEGKERQQCKGKRSRGREGKGWHIFRDHDGERHGRLLSDSPKPSKGSKRRVKGFG